MKNSSHCREFNLGSQKRGPVHAGSPLQEQKIALESDPLSLEDSPAPSGLRLGMHPSIVMAACGPRQRIAANGAWRAFNVVQNGLSRDSILPRQHAQDASRASPTAEIRIGSQRKRRSTVSMPIRKWVAPTSMSAVLWVSRPSGGNWRRGLHRYSRHFDFLPVCSRRRGVLTLISVP
jgi:hypothetical protein